MILRTSLNFVSCLHAHLLSPLPRRRRQTFSDPTGKMDVVGRRIATAPLSLSYPVSLISHLITSPMVIFLKVRCSSHLCSPSIVILALFLVFHYASLLLLLSCPPPPVSAREYVISCGQILAASVQSLESQLGDRRIPSQRVSPVASEGWRLLLCSHCTACNAISYATARLPHGISHEKVCKTYRVALT